MRAKVRLNTPAEDAAIQRGIAADPDTVEWSTADFTAATAAVDVVPEDLYAALIRRRGPGRRPAKVPVTFKLDPVVLEALRATGPGWQTRAGQALAALAKVKT